MSNIFEEIKNSFNRGDNAIRKLIFINSAVFIVTTILGKIPFEWTKIILENLPLPHLFHVFIKQPWSLFTYIFMHANIWHILSNMLWLYFIGEIFRNLVGNKHIYQTFILGGISGGILYLIVLNIVPHYAEMNEAIRLVGASGGVTAVIIATATFIPEYEIRPFGLFSIKLKWIATIFILYNILALGNGDNDGGILAHLGGAIFGFVYVKWMKGQYFLPNLKGVFKFKKKVKRPIRDFKVNINNQSYTSKTSDAHSQKEIDSILDKISKSGYDSLTKKEKEILFKASKEL
ncbi:MAG: rhomboid family intramembrane serine protease [Bacteroidetes bacterium]|nr:rhomboid family intramembrane serine protease [Bacteroidota bacterium]